MTINYQHSNWHKKMVGEYLMFFQNNRRSKLLHKIKLCAFINLISQKFSDSAQEPLRKSLSLMKRTSTRDAIIFSLPLLTALN